MQHLYGIHHSHYHDHHGNRHSHCHHHDNDHSHYHHHGNHHSHHHYYDNDHFHLHHHHGNHHSHYHHHNNNHSRYHFHHQNNHQDNHHIDHHYHHEIEILQQQVHSIIFCQIFQYIPNVFQILTKDQAAVLIGASVQFLIKDPVASKGVVQDLNHSMRVLAQTTLVNIMMTQKLIEIQNDKKFIGIHAQVNTLSSKGPFTPISCAWEFTRERKNVCRSRP